MKQVVSIMRCFVLIPVLFLTGVSAFDETFAKGNEAYYQGNYAAATLAYEQLVGSSVSNPVVFYNLGNAYYRQGRLGEAIVNYERALRLRPGMAGAEENLEKALRATERNLARPLPASWEESLFFWHSGFSFGTVRNLAMVFWLLAWGLLAIRQWRPVRYSRRFAVLAAVLAVSFSGSAWLKTHGAELAVAKEETVSVRFGKSENESVRFELYAGDRVQVDAFEEGWARVTTVSGERGWARADALLLVGQPVAFDTFSTRTEYGDETESAL